GAPTPVVSDGAIVIAAITSCTNTSNPSVMFGAGLIAQHALGLGLRVPPYVKTSLAPGSKVVTDYLQRAGLLQPLSDLGFALVGFGCTTCIGNSGPLPAEVAKDIAEHDRFVAAVLSGNRNFEARIHNQVRANYLASPMLVVAYALAGRMDVDLTRDPLGHRPDGTPVRLQDLWPTSTEIQRLVEADLDPAMFREKYRAIEVGDAHWEGLQPPHGDLYAWDPASTYLSQAPYLHLPPPWVPRAGNLAEGARVLLAFGDQISTDHISPAGEFPESTPAGQYLRARGVLSTEFNTYGARRGDHEVMVRGTFANVRLKNQLVAPKEGGWTVHLPSGELLSVFDAAQRYRSQNVPLIVLAGTSYGQGSSRDWAAKGPRLLGVGAVIAESFERIHRSNLIEMGVLPLRFAPGQGWKALGLTGRESFRLRLASGSELTARAAITMEATRDDGTTISTTLECALHSPIELEYYLAGGVLPYVMSHRFAP
ncbi:MAG: aconitase family protein, partial [Thermoplasmata archaeon]